jgi:Fe-S cluster assembly protein SufD
VIDHANPHCTSSEYYKAIVSDKATGSFQGRVLIQEGAVGSCSDQLNRNLLLGEAAVANTKPQLEIDNDDVKATHGSTVGRLDSDAVFYLMARGLPKNEARAFLVRAFAGELIEKVSAEDLRADLVAMFDVRLEQVGSVV